MEYKTVEFMTAKEKELTVKQFKRFVESLTEDFGKTFTDKYGNELELSFKYFTKRVYEHLHCGFIAHYDILGFYSTYFTGNIEDLKRFLEHFVEDGEVKPYRSTEDYDDINLAFAEILKKNLDRLLKVFGDNTREQDIHKIKFLMAKHNLQEIK